MEEITWVQAAIIVYRAALIEGLILSETIHDDEQEVKE